MTPLHGIACFYDVGFGARAVSRKTPIYFIISMSIKKKYFIFYIFWHKSQNRKKWLLAAELTKSGPRKKGFWPFSLAGWFYMDRNNVV